jgi:peptide deformylase
MSIQTILKMGDSRLNQVAQAVQTFDTPSLHQLIADEMNPRYPNEEPIPATTLINPVIKPLGNEQQLGWEGCLSVPGMRAQVPRWMHIQYTGFDVHGLAITRQVSGFHARVVQHECDHLLGVLYPSKVTDFSQFGFVEALFPELAALEGKQ